MCRVKFPAWVLREGVYWTLLKYFIVGWAVPTKHRRYRLSKVGGAHPTSIIQGTGTSLLHYQNCFIICTRMVGIYYHKIKHQRNNVILIFIFYRRDRSLRPIGPMPTPRWENAEKGFYDSL
jgi:hypothetical protein